MKPGRTGILGGTFDPVHNGHLILAQSALEEAELDEVIFVPTGHSWRKPDREITPAENRLAMLRLAVDRRQGFGVSDLEIRRGGPTYTVDTLEELHARDPERELYFIVGADALQDMPNWRQPEGIAELATVLVADRSGECGEPMAAIPGLKVVRLAMPVVAISATEIRRRVGEGRSIADLVPPAVAEYIGMHRLYHEEREGSMS